MAANPFAANPFAAPVAPVVDETNPFAPGYKPPGSSFLRRAVSDTALAVGQGVVGVGEAAVGALDIPTMGRFGKALKDYAGYDPRATTQFLEEQKTPEQQAANRAVAEAKGFGGTLSAFAQNPSVIPQKVAETVPLIAGGGAIARALPAKLSALARGAIGEAVLGAGLSAEQSRQASATGTITPGQAGLALTSGVLTGAITKGAGTVANKLGIGDVEQLLAGGKITPVQAKGMLRRGAEGAVVEGLLEEAPQSAQEQALQNIALGRPVGEGVPEAATTGGVLGSVIGGGVAALPQRAPLAAVPPGVEAVPGVVPPAEPVAPDWSTVPGVYPEGQPVDPGAPPPLVPGWETAPGAVESMGHVRAHAEGGPGLAPPPAGPIGRALATAPLVAPPFETALGAGVTTTSAEDISGAYRDREIAALFQEVKAQQERSRDFGPALAQQREQQGEVAMARGRAEGVGDPQPKTAMQLAFEKARGKETNAIPKTLRETKARQTADEAAGTLRAAAAAGRIPSDAGVAQAVVAQAIATDKAREAGALEGASQKGAAKGGPVAAEGQAQAAAEVKTGAGMGLSGAEEGGVQQQRGGSTATTPAQGEAYPRDEAPVKRIDERLADAGAPAPQVPATADPFRLLTIARGQGGKLTPAYFQSRDEAEAAAQASPSAAASIERRSGKTWRTVIGGGALQTRLKTRVSAGIPGAVASQPLVTTGVVSRETPKGEAQAPAVDLQDEVRLKQLEARRFKTQPQEKQIEHLKKRIAADPRKWSVGDGVGWRATPTQINRGYRIKSIDPKTKAAVIQSVADTGLTTTGGNTDRMQAQVVHIADVVRDKKYDGGPAAVQKEAIVAPLPAGRKDSAQLSSVGQAPAAPTDERLRDPGTQSALSRMADNAGWSQRGGQLLRDANDNVTGRTTWVSKEAWFAELPERLNTEATVEAVRKAIAGEKLGAKERRVVGFMLDSIDREREAGAAVGRAPTRGAPTSVDAERAAIIAEADMKLDALADGDMESLFSYDTLNGDTLEKFWASDAAPSDQRANEADAARAPGSRGAPNEEARPDERPFLDSYTETDLKERDEAKLATERAEAALAAARQAEREATEALVNFTLTGSNREADEAAARGQQSLLDPPAGVTAKPTGFPDGSWYPVDTRTGEIIKTTPEGEQTKRFATIEKAVAFGEKVLARKAPDKPEKATELEAKPDRAALEPEWLDLKRRWGSSKVGKLWKPGAPLAVRTRGEKLIKLLSVKPEQGTALYSRATGPAFGQSDGLFEKPDVPVTELSGTELTANKTIGSLRAAAERKLRSLDAGALKNDETEWTFSIGRQDWKKMARAPGQTAISLRAIGGIESLAKHAVLAESHQDRKRNPDVMAVHRLYAPVQIGGHLFRAKLTVREYARTVDGKSKNLHALEAVEIESPDGIRLALRATQGAYPPAQPPGPALSITDLLRGAVRDSDGRPFDPAPAKYSYAGERGAATPKHALAAAREMAGQGIPMEEIRKTTGWFKTKDAEPGAERWRYELSDKDAKLKPNWDAYGNTIGDALAHKVLFENYPSLAKIDLVFRFDLPANVTGGYAPADNAIHLNANLTPEGAKSTLLHELQHGVQVIEGFARGGKPTDKAFISAAAAMGIDTTDKSTMVLAYRRLLGEVEARDVQARASLTAEELRERPPYESQGIPEKDFIVQFKGEGAASIAQTDTPAFKAWFLDSKVVNAEGRPKVVYHGSAADFSVFSPRGEATTKHPSRELGHFFTDLTDEAGQFATMVGTRETGANIMPVYLSIQNPAEIDSQAFFRATRTVELAKAYKAGLVKAGHDGIAIRFGDRMQYAAFRPEQIKSATGNRGTFDPNNPDIAYSIEAGAGQSVTELRANLAARLRKRAFARLVGSKEFRIVANDEDLPAHLQHPEGAVRGVYDPASGVSYLVASNIPPGEEFGILLHELGIHAKLKGLLGPKLYGEIMGQVKAILSPLERAIADGKPETELAKIRERIAAQSPLAAALVEARGRVPNDTKAAHVLEESIAYLVEGKANQDLPIVRRILAAIRAWLLRQGIPLHNLTSEDLVALARAGVRSASRGETVQVGRRAPTRGAPTGARYAAEAPIFYSEMAKFIDSKAPGKTTAAQWKVLLEGWAKAGKFKADELEWSGVKEWLDLPAAVHPPLHEYIDKHGGTEEAVAAWEKLSRIVTKDQVLGFVRENAMRGLPLFSRKAQDPNRQITVTDLHGDEISTSGKLTWRNATAWAKTNARGSHPNDDTGWNISVASKGIEEAAHLAKTQAELQSFAALSGLIKNAVLVESMADREGRPEIREVHTFYAPLRIGQDLYSAKLIVRDTNMGNKYYGHRLEGLEIKKPNVVGVGREPEGSLGVTRPLGLTVRLGDLLPESEPAGISGERQSVGSDESLQPAAGSEPTIAAPGGPVKGPQGPLYSRATGDNHVRGLQAAKAALLNKSDVAAAVTHPTLGPITIGYGDPGTAKKDYRDGHGLSHIIVRRALEGEDPGETLVHVIDVAANGKPGRRYGPRGGERVDIKLGDYTAVVSLYRFGDKETWLLTGFKGMPGAQRVSVNPLDYAPEASGIPQQVVADIVTRIDQALAELNKGPQAPLYSRGPTRFGQLGRIVSGYTGQPSSRDATPPPPSNPFNEENRRLREEDKTAWNRAKTFWQRNFTPGGLLPAQVFEQKRVRDGELGVVELDTENLVAQLDHAVGKVYGKRMEELTKEQRETLQSALTGKVDENLDLRARTVILAMRQHVDRMSDTYLQIVEAQIAEMSAGFDQGEQALFDAFLGMREVEPAFDSPADKGRATRERNRIMDEAKEAATAAWGDAKPMQAALGKVADVAVKAGVLRTITGNLGRYVHRSYRAFDDPKHFSKLSNEVIDKARAYLRARNIEGGMAAAEAAEKAERALHTIVKTGTAYDSMEAFIAEGKLGAKDLSILIRRKDIAPEIRALLGEYDDPRLNYAKSTSKMARLIWNTRFLDRVREIGMGTFLFEERDAPPGATTQIAADASEVYAPLNGLWTFPEIDQAFKDAVGKEKMADWYRVIVQMNGAVKYGKVILSPTTQIRNFMSAAFFALANGHFDIRHVAKSVDTLRGKSPEYARTLTRLGIMDNGAYAGEMMQLIRDSKIEEILRDKKSTPYRVWRDLNAFAKKAYRNGDDFWKIVGFENEKASLMAVGVAEAQAETEAAERIRNTYPTYSMVGRGIKWLARFPLAGTFVSFPAEIIRTSGHMLRYIAKDYQDQQRRPLALRRAAGLAMVSGFAYALQEMTKAMIGMDDDEEEEAVRRLAAPWQKNSNFLFTGRNDEGQLRYFDLSFLDPYNWFKRPITAMLRNQPWEDKAVGALTDMLSPFLGTDIAAGALFEVLANKKESGGEVFNEFATPVDQSVAIVNHLRKALQPGFVSNMERTYRAAKGDYTPSGKKYDLADEGMSWIGWRATTLQPKTALFYRAFEFSDAKAAATATLTRTLRSPNEVSREAIADAKASAQRQLSQGYKDMRLIVGAAMKNGLSRSDVIRVLRTSGVALRDIPLLLSDREPTIRITPQQIRNATTNARAIFGPEKASEIRRRYLEAQRSVAGPTQ